MAYLGSTPARAPLSSAQIEDGTIATADIADDAVTTAKITAANVTTAKIADANITAAKVSSDVAQLGKNLIQNGKFEVNQRGSTDVAAGAAGYGPDRWSVLSGVTAAYTLTSDTSVPTGQGFLNSFKVDITTADSSISSG